MNETEQITVPPALKQWVEQTCDALTHAAAREGIHLKVLGGSLLKRPGHMIVQAKVIAPYDDLIPIAPCIRRMTKWTRDV